MSFTDAIDPADHWPPMGFESLRQESRAEGMHHVERLNAEMAAGGQDFLPPHGRLFIAKVAQHAGIIAVGGFTPDPFVDDDLTGRVRRLYVRPAWRCKGAGRTLLARIVADAGAVYSRLILRARPGAALFFERAGFIPITSGTATHALDLDRTP